MSRRIERVVLTTPIESIEEPVVSFRDVVTGNKYFSVLAHYTKEKGWLLTEIVLVTILEAPYRIADIGWFIDTRTKDHREDTIPVYCTSRSHTQLLVRYSPHLGETVKTNKGSLEISFH